MKDEHPATDQASMRKAAHTPIDGPASTDRLAAGGGLELPAGESREGLPAGDVDPGAALIPGAREGDTLTHREPASVGGIFNGGDIPAEDPHWLDERTSAEHRREGGMDSDTRGTARRNNG